MYQKFSAYKQWKFEVLEVDISEVGGYKVGFIGYGGSMCVVCKGMCLAVEL